MKNIKRISVIILAIALAAMFAGCGIAKNEGGNGGGGAVIPKPEETTLEGTYYADYDISEIVAASITAEYDIDASYPLYMNLYITLKEDDSFEMGFDMETFLANTREYYAQIFPRMIKSTFADNGITNDADIEARILNMGYASMDEYIQELIDQAMAEVESQYSGESGNILSEGTYTVDGDKIELIESGYSTATDSGTINGDGTITIEDVPVEGNYVDIVFSK